MSAPSGDWGTALVFPGIKPSPFDDLGKFLLVNPIARKLTAIADDTLGYSLIDHYRQADSEYSEYERVSFLVVCLALAYWAEETMDLEADACAGASFGGTPAAVYAGSLDFAEAIWLTARWNDCVRAYFARENGDVVTQSFARTPESRLAEILQELDDAGEWYEIACHVDDDFWMLSVRERRLGWLQSSLRALGGMPMYTMRTPMHSRAFAPLRDMIEEELVDKLQFSDPVLPIVCDHDGTVLGTADEVRRLLLDGVVRTVRWPAAMTTLAGHNVDRVVVSGPDGLWGRVDCVRRTFDVVTLTPAMALRPRPRKAAVA
ncbi:ACP S-malonyltransferase [Streptomyces sp. NPDC015127]|uniref:ACP S-malonyltransferase n=1 Tax=Streptomyces sp. NPDC015127 TaxID=3364939 RepID=UPI0036FEFE89